MDRSQDDHQRGRVARAAFFLLVWFTATLFLLGDLGKFQDDWIWHMRDPVTGGFCWSDLLARDYFHFNTLALRPLHMRVAPAMQTLLWNHDPAIHLILAAIHAINAWLLWKVLGRMCAGRIAPAAGALVFLVYPAHAEAVFWLSTIGTLVGTAWLLLCTLAVQRYAAGEIRLRTLLLHLPLLLTLGWWYEQAAASGPALAAAFLATAGGERFEHAPAGWPVRRRLAVSAIIAAVGLAAGAAYAAILMGTIDPSARGGVGKLVRPDGLSAQFGLIFSQAGAILSLRGFAGGAIEEGWRAIRSRPAEAALLGSALAVSASAFGSWWMRGRTADAPGRSASPRGVPGPLNRWSAAAFGAGIFAASMVPVLAVSGQWFVSRLAYFPVLGLSITLAAALDGPMSTGWATGRRALGRAVRGAALAALLASVMLCAVMFIGVQSVWHKRMVQDRQIAHELRQSLQGVHVPSGTLFVPVGIAGWPTTTRSHGGTFERFATTPFELPWSSEGFMRMAVHRADVHATGFNRWADSAHGIVETSGGTPRGLVVMEGKFPAESVVKLPDGRQVVPWDRVVAFRVVPGGHIRMVDRFIIEDPDNPANDHEAMLPLLAGTIGARASRPAVLLFAREKQPGTVVSASASPWTLSNSGGRDHGDGPPPSFGPAGAQKRQYPAFTMHPAVAAIPDRGTLSADLAPSERPRVIAFRVALPDYTLDRTDGVEVAVTVIDNGAVTTLARQSVTPRQLRREQRWLVVRAVIPPADHARRCRVQVWPGPAGNPDFDWCYVTPPALADRAAE